MKYTPTACILSQWVMAFAVTLSASFTWADPNAQVYMSGKQLAAKFADFVKAEKGFYTAVPVDYANPAKGKFDIYAYWAKPFDPALPTTVVFFGGPGQTAHTKTHRETLGFQGFNTLLVDQRGLAFSRPDSEALWKSRDFYSSEFVARDFEEIRKQLGIAKWSLYGASYGTVPATIYASLFPEHTTAAVLEGTVGGGADGIPWDSYYIADLMQKNYDSMTSEQKAKANADALAGNSTIVRSGVTEDPSQLEADVHALYMIKEFGLGRHDISGDYTIKNGKIEKTLTEPANSYAEYADTLGFQKDNALRKSTYDPANYPVRVPLFYLQGSVDTRTTPAWSIYHAMVAPQGQFQHILFHGVGHYVSATLLVSDSYAIGMAKMLRGELLKMEEAAVMGLYAGYLSELRSDRKSLEAIYQQYLAPRVGEAPALDCARHVKKQRSANAADLLK